ncbi:D-lactaldehyde dehydrogenase [Vararia minispora EC-137]|uniref:D-lactaldehyde dehydrogenase n=1 Tax=Vararia minispora EC-137 TaxID=1314806 RepID=A0ACB8QJD4_9AGAM|nr:D-lactaldehyde dehydrogenase [Vararia minispora EC-137]
MPAVPAPAKVLVSGVNGYVGIWVASAYLEHGYSVRGTVRSIERAGKHIKDTFAKHGDKFELVEVADITASGAFDEAVKDVDLIAHTASPFHFLGKEPSELIDPAVKGTVSILESVYAHAPTAKRVVITASIVSVWTYLIDSPRTFNELDWNEQAVNLVKEKGAEAGPATIYGASKTLAEKAAWEFVEKNKPSWDLVTINPPYVFGPPIHEVNSADALNTSQKFLFDILTGKLPEDGYETVSHNLVDVRDVAEIHARAAELPQAGGTRCLISAGAFYPQDELDIANSIEPKPWDGLPKGRPGVTKDKRHLITVSTDQFDRVYGFKMHTPAETIGDSLKDFKARGWIA